MLSYQHEYHAGNFADVLKHCCLLEILSSLAQKEKPFTIIDTHAGSSIYSLNDERILKTLEAENGIEKLLQFTRDRQTPLPHSVTLYLEKETPFIQNDNYAGSPELERQFIRENDVLHLVELHPEAYRKLQDNIDSIKDKNQSIHIHNSDSFATLNALTPPKIKRGLILCDPSYEDKDDFRKTATALINAHKKWNTAIIAVWYPLLTRRQNEINQMTAALETAAKTGNNPCTVYKCELSIYDSDSIPEEMSEQKASHMYGSGMFIINPPWQLDSKMNETLGFLKSVFCSSQAQ
ncbi:MAG: 23S rRNA (adenine(2030)-N(6))-methyltransferase RlmJ [Treponema sp.]|nr:23S rRNA (adenine(2030)-N(6))-methyltransferase RlmJ [Treponema sp.]